MNDVEAGDFGHDETYEPSRDEAAWLVLKRIPEQVGQDYCQQRGPLQHYSWPYRALVPLSSFNVVSSKGISFSI